MAVPSKMKALLLRESGFALGPSGGAIESMEPYLELTTTAVPSPSASEVLIKVGLASVNPSDIMLIKGLYGRPRIKGRPAGLEGVGVVVAAGRSAEAKALAGRRVAFSTETSDWGSWAGYAVAGATACIALEDAVKDTDGAAMIVNPMTALALLDIVRDAGEKAFVLAAGASQISKLIIAAAREEGFRAISIVRLHYQIPRLKEAGAAHVLNTQAQDYQSNLRELLQAERPRVLLDAVTGPLASGVFDLMAEGARWVIYGRLDGSATAIKDPSQMIFNNKRIEGFWVGSWIRRHSARRTEIEQDAQRRFVDGRWSTDVTAVIPLSEAIERVPSELMKPNGKVFLAP